MSKAELYTPEQEQMMSNWKLLSALRRERGLLATIAERDRRIATAMLLLARATELLADSPVKNDPAFWKDLYLFTGQYMILTDEGWENGDNKQSYVELAEKEGLPIGDFILDEVNAPACSKCGTTAHDGEYVSTNERTPDEHQS